MATAETKCGGWSAYFREVTRPKLIAPDEIVRGMAGPPVRPELSQPKNTIHTRLPSSHLPSRRRALQRADLCGRPLCRPPLWSGAITVGGEPRGNGLMGPPAPASLVRFQSHGRSKEARDLDAAGADAARRGS
jgi:hypothetical protein